jgi:hypothetical protein
MEIFVKDPLYLTETSLSIVLRRNDVRLIGRNDLASSYDVRPVFEIKITLTLCHASGLYPRARQAMKILTSSQIKFQFNFSRVLGRFHLPPQT